MLVICNNNTYKHIFKSLHKYHILQKMITNGLNQYNKLCTITHIST